MEKAPQKSDLQEHIKQLEVIFFVCYDFSSFNGAIKITVLRRYHMKKRLLYLILPIITLVLELLPYGAVCNFANPEGPPWRRTFSYFSLTPFGYANFSPLLTAVLICVVLVLLLVYLFTSKHRIVKATKILLCLAVVLSLCPLLLGISYFSVVGVLITVSLIAEFALLLFSDRATNV